MSQASEPVGYLHLNRSEPFRMVPVVDRQEAESGAVFSLSSFPSSRVSGMIYGGGWTVQRWVESQS